MEDNKSMADTHGYLRLAIPLMSKHSIPVTPRNYSVWYNYVSGADGDLSRAIDIMLEKGEKFTDEKNEALYKQFCMEKSENELATIRNDLQQILLTVLGQMTELTGHANEYESFVSTSVNMLSDNASVQEIKKVIHEISDKTKTLGNYGKALQHKLEETTKSLEMLKKDLERAKTDAFVDFLTGIPNRKAFDDRLNIFISDAATDKIDFCLLLIDIDHFKRFNDEYGHLIGDEVLKFVARKIRTIVRGKDFLARFGGEEFAVILPQTPLTGAEVVAESIRSFFAQSILKAGTTSKKLGKITVSIGVACHHSHESSNNLVGRCDQALYLAKNSGRNCVATEYDLVAEFN